MPKHPVLLRAGKWLTLAMVLCLAPLCFGESMVVKVLNGSNGEPVSDQLVTVKFHYGKSATVEKRNVMLLHKTDSRGEARFEIPEVKPDSLKVHVDFKERGLHCSCSVLTEPATVIREGLMVPHRVRQAKTSSHIEAGPGHIVFVARQSRLLEKIMYEY